MYIGTVHFAIADEDKLVKACMSRVVFQTSSESPGGTELSMKVYTLEDFQFLSVSIIAC